MSPLPRVAGPDGEVAEYDRAATELAYASFAGNSCTCLGCQNFRSAFDPTAMDADLRDVCSTIGVDPFKAVETTFYNIDPETGLAIYSGECPFVGRLFDEITVHKSYWGFSRGLVPQDAFGDTQAVVHFSILLPWILSESPPK